MFQRILLSFRSKLHYIYEGISLILKKAMNPVAIPTAYVLLMFESFGIETIFSRPNDLNLVVICL
jgi:hypothetical protein